MKNEVGGGADKKKSQGLSALVKREAKGQDGQGGGLQLDIEGADALNTRDYTKAPTHFV